MSLTEISWGDAFQRACTEAPCKVMRPGEENRDLAMSFTEIFCGDLVGIVHSSFYTEPVKEILHTVFTELLTQGACKIQPGISVSVIHVPSNTVSGLLLRYF